MLHRIIEQNIQSTVLLIFPGRVVNALLRNISCHRVCLVCQLSFQKPINRGYYPATPHWVTLRPWKSLYFRKHFWGISCLVALMSQGVIQRKCSNFQFDNPVNIRLQLCYVPQKRVVSVNPVDTAVVLGISVHKLHERKKEQLLHNLIDWKSFLHESKSSVGDYQVVRKRGKYSKRMFSMMRFWLCEYNQCYRVLHKTNHFISYRYETIVKTLFVFGHRKIHPESC